MKPLVFKANSWHYWLVHEIGGYKSTPHTDNLCEYTKAFVLSVALASFLATIGGFVMYALGITIAWWVAGLLYGFVDAEIPIIATMLIVVFGGGGSLAYLSSKIANHIKNQRYERRSVAAADWFLPNAWQALKEKTCVKIVVVSDKDNTNEDN